MTEDTTQRDSLPDVVSTAKEAVGEEAESRIYEIGYLIVPTVPESELSREVTALKDALDREKTALISQEFPKLRQLAYPMHKRAGLSANGSAEAGEGYQKYTSGYFGWVKFEAAPGSALRVERDLKEFPHLLRYLLIKTVREHTLTLGRPRAERRERKKAPQGTPAGTPVSEAELDKSLEKLIAE